MQSDDAKRLEMEDLRAVLGALTNEPRWSHQAKRLDGELNHLLALFDEASAQPDFEENMEWQYAVGDAQAFAHLNFPEICPCTDCAEQRETIEAISEQAQGTPHHDPGDVPG